MSNILILKRNYKCFWDTYPLPQNLDLNQKKTKDIPFPCLCTKSLESRTAPKMQKVN